MLAQPDICLVQPDIWWVAHVIIVSAQVPLVLTLGLWTWDFGPGLDNTDWTMLDVCVRNQSLSQPSP